MTTQNTFGSKSNADAACDAEATLRLIASLPAPRGLEERMIAGLQAAPRSGRVLGWPGVLVPNRSWLRSAAAAAIVSVVVGGGWSIYNRVQPNTAASVQPRTAPTSGFSNAGAVRVPQTVPLLVQEQAVSPEPAKAEPQAKGHGKLVPPARQRAGHKGTRPSASSRPSVTVAK